MEIEKRNTRSLTFFADKHRSRIAGMLLLVWMTNILLPIGAYALTSGPTQPEAQGFQPAGVSDMVDLFTGDFKYNIPLMDVDGYPLNLNYQSGVNMDDEASWVGLGWNLNIGAINRQLRGIPDDFAGDTIETEHYTKPKITIGGKLTAKVEMLGGAKVKGSFTLGVFNDNYTGVGAEIGANAGISFDLTNSGSLTAGLGMGVSSSTASGVDFSPTISLSVNADMNEKKTAKAGLSTSLGYNSRSGMKDQTLGGSFGFKNQGEVSHYIGTSVSYNTEPINPRIQIPYVTEHGSFSIDAGAVAFGLFIGGGGSGYKTVMRVRDPKLINREYGFMYAERGKDDKTAMMDFTREKENPIIPELPNLALPVHTPDMFSYTSQTGSGQFRLYRGGSGSFFDNEVSNKSEVSSLGFDAGFGGYAHFGAVLFRQNTNNTTRKWSGGENQYLDKGDFQDADPSDPSKEHVFFRMIGEQSIQDDDIVSKIHGEEPLAVSISGKVAQAGFTGSAANYSINSPLYKKQRQLKQTVISYLTAAEAKKAALDHKVLNYPTYDTTFVAASGHHLEADSTARVNASVRKKHHISEISVLDKTGKRMVYGVPVYNLKQEEYSFAVGNRARGDYAKVGDNLTALNISGGKINNFKGIDHFYHKETTPAYASSFLLSGILSPDYVDLTGNGISNDDQGTAIKFNYSKMPFVYKWRTPYAKKNGSGYYKTATLNRGLLADPDDDKASIIYGEKELYYISSIESKTKIAYFITADREDGLGVQDWQGLPDTQHKQKLLKEIRLYSKADTSRPIKVVKFAYSYQLAPGTPNSIAAGGGKLTLTRIWFEYGNTTKGKNHPYIFSYQVSADGSSTPTPYAVMSTDRWGVFKTTADNPNSGYTNEEFPYTGQSSAAQAAKNAALWHLKKIELPSGGEINVNYEADDYAYVQNKKAMAMVPLQGMINTVPTKLAGASGIKIAIDSLPPSGTADVTGWFRNTYLNGSEYIYCKVYVRVSTPNATSYGNDYDFVPVFSKVRQVSIEGSTASIILESMEQKGVQDNPIAFSSWQHIKEDYPRYAFPGFENRTTDGDASKGIRAAVSAIFSAIENFSDLKENFYEQARRKSYGTLVDLSKSFVRIAKTDGHKLGGGVRVKKITISDDWQEMSDTETAINGIYGQEYDYTAIINNKKVSSGVAAYEPQIGSDENPLRQPVPYVQHIKGALSNYYDLEEPFGESFFPAPSVGYSSVTVRDLGKNGETDPGSQNGWVVNEFYTAKDFPVRVKVLPIKRLEPTKKNKANFIGSDIVNEVCISQGYSIELNDMHGKPRAVKVLNQSGSEISSTVYYYNAVNSGAGEMRLKNTVNVIREDGSVVSDQVIGRDIEFFTDFREQEAINRGETVNIGADLIPFFLFPATIPHFPYGQNDQYNLFRSACAVKVVQYYGIVDKVVKTENGSSVETSNIAYDGFTGEPLVTRTTNEFNKDIYSVNLPAYWAYRNMGGAYANTGIVLSGLSTASGALQNYTTYLHAGDEMVDLDTGIRYWVIEDPVSHALRLANVDGVVLQNATLPFTKIIRSGLRNILGASTSQLTCLKNPIQGSQFVLASNTGMEALKVINASTTLFTDVWSQETELKYKTRVVSDTSHVFNIIDKITTQVSDQGTKLYKLDGTVDTVLDNGILKFRFAERAVWFDDTFEHTKDEDVGMEYEVNIPVSGTYYIGYGGDDSINVKIGTKNLPVPQARDSSYRYWHIAPVTLPAGTHLLQISAKNEHNSNPIYDNYNDNPGIFSVEIYTNAVDRNHFINSGWGTAYNPLTLFHTREVSDTDVQTYRTINGVKVYRNRTERYFDEDLKINPYVQGFAGNWRMSESVVFQSPRKYGDVFTASTRGVGVKDAGYISNFYSYWYHNGQKWAPTGNTKWITANTLTLYDRYGQELENRDALGRYSSALFCFNGDLPAAVSSNAMNREIYVNSFEDQHFRKQRPQDTLKINEFRNFGDQKAIYEYAGDSKAHTGNYSILLPVTGLTINTEAHQFRHRAASYLDQNGAHEFVPKTVPGVYPRGFEPLPSKKYVFSVWVQDEHPANKSVNLVLNVNSVAVPLSCRAVTEGWKLLEGTFTTGEAGLQKITFLPATGSTVYADDIRIHPFDSQLKTYAYNEKTFRLMAELDENGFATLYEYDDEGSLVRVKKETERGIMTLKESRSSYRKR